MDFMLHRIPYIPSAQVALALFLHVINSVRHFPSREPWTQPERLLCNGINAPVAFFTTLLLKLDVRDALRFNYLKDLFVLYVLYFVLVWALWRCVLLEVGTNPDRTSVITPLTHVRGAADLLCLAFGGFLIAVATNLHFPLRLAIDWSRYTLFQIPCLLWGISISFFYSRDLCIYMFSNTHGYHSFEEGGRK